MTEAKAKKVLRSICVQLAYLARRAGIAEKGYCKRKKRSDVEERTISDFAMAVAGQVAVLESVINDSDFPRHQVFQLPGRQIFRRAFRDRYASEEVHYSVSQRLEMILTIPDKGQVQRSAHRRMGTDWRRTLRGISGVIARCLEESKIGFAIDLYTAEVWCCCAFKDMYGYRGYDDCGLGMLRIVCDFKREGSVVCIHLPPAYHVPDNALPIELLGSRMASSYGDWSHPKRIFGNPYACRYNCEENDSEGNSDDCIDYDESDGSVEYDEEEED